MTPRPHRPEKGSDPAKPMSSSEALQRVMKTAPELVRLEFTIDSQPIWAPSTYADERKREYPLEWRGEGASVTVQASGEYGMMRWFDKLVLAALVRLWNEQGRNEKGNVRFLISDIIKILERSSDGKTYDLIKQSLHRLRGCLIQYRHSFKDVESGEFVSLRDKNILSDLLIIEPKKEDSFGLDVPQGLTFCQLDFDVVRNLLGDYTRPVSITLLQSLSEKGILFESYINSVLYRRPKVVKDVFELWSDLGLSTKGLEYGSRLVSRMKKDLEKIAADKSSLLESYEFEKSKSRPKSKNLVLYRREDVEVKPAGIKRSSRPSKRIAQRGHTEIERLVEWMQLELHDESDDATNLRVIASKMPEDLIKQHAYEAFAAYRDGRIPNPTAYFVGIMARIAGERGVDLGFKRKKGSGAGRPNKKPKPLNLRREGSGMQSLGDALTGIVPPERDE